MRWCYIQEEFYKGGRCTCTVKKVSIFVQDLEWNDTVIGQVVMASVALPIDTPPPGVVHSG